MARAPPPCSIAWNHNASYHRLVLRRLPPGSQRVLDAGCGAGEPAVRLARRVPHVDAVDRDDAMVELARRAAVNVAVRQADLLSDPLPGSGYDAVVSLSVLHHLPLDVVLPRLDRTRVRDGLVCENDIFVDTGLFGRLTGTA